MEKKQKKTWENSQIGILSLLNMCFYLKRTLLYDHICCLHAEMDDHETTHLML